MQDQFVVMAGCEYPARPSFAKNAICHSRAEAEEECRRRNLAERINGNTGVRWFINVHDVAMQKLFAEINKR